MTTQQIACEHCGGARLSYYQDNAVLFRYPVNPDGTIAWDQESNEYEETNDSYFRCADCGNKVCGASLNDDLIVVLDF